MNDFTGLQQPHRRCAFCGEGLTCEHGLCDECQRCRECERERQREKDTRGN
jgi:predicted nucleic acid-binding Zn ribbon protein